MYVCHHCGEPTTNIHPGKDDRCQKCGYHLRACENCQYYDGHGCILGLPYVLTSAIHGNQCPRFKFRDTSEEEFRVEEKQQSLNDVEISTIVVAIDGSPQTEKVISRAVHMAKTHGAHVFLVHAYSGVSEWLGREQMEKSVAKSIERAKRVVAPWVELMEEAGIKPDLELLEGPAAKAILAVADTREADIIIMGSRGLNPIEELMLGSVSEQVVRRAHCPVLIIR